MLLLFIFTYTFCTDPLILSSIEYKDSRHIAHLIINLPGEYILSLCYNKDIENTETWKEMIRYSDDIQYKDIKLPKEGDYKLFYSFRLQKDDSYYFCQPFRYTKQGYKEMKNDKKNKMKKKVKVKEKNKFPFNGVYIGVFAALIACVLLIFFSSN